MLSQLDAFQAFSSAPEGLEPGADAGALITGTLLGLDADARSVQVSVAGSEGVWVPAQPGIYSSGAPVRLLRSPLDGGRITACLGPLTTADLIVRGVVTAVNTAAGTLTVGALGGSYELPYSSGTYAVSTPVNVLRDPQAFGRPVFVLGVLGNYVAPGGETPGGGTDNPAGTVTREAVITPQDAASWRYSQGRWDTWNTDRYGGRTTLWQGNAVGSGPMIGLAVYGDQIVNLAAIAITRMQVSVYRADSSFSDGRVAIIQPSPHGSRPGGAPAVDGAGAASPALAPGQSAQVDLPSSVFEQFRTGAFKGLATVGSSYAGYSGPPSGVAPTRADGFALVVQYTTKA